MKTSHLLLPPHTRPGRPLALQARVVSVPCPSAPSGWSSVCIPERLLPDFLDEAGGCPATLTAALRSAAVKVGARDNIRAGQSYGAAVRATALVDLATARAASRARAILSTKRGHVVTPVVTSRDAAPAGSGANGGAGFAETARFSSTPDTALSHA